MRNDKLFSVILPVYNCEKYLSQCLESLCSQENFTHNYEIILINDGSTDKSGEICDSFAAKYDFIRVTHTDNHGASRARNLALKQAEGDYILFCDSDDIVSPQLIQVMTRAVELDNKADIFEYKFFRLPEGQAYKWPVYNVEQMKISDWSTPSSDEACKKVIIDSRVGAYLWDKVFRRTLVQDCSFDESLLIMDDEGWVLEVLCADKNIRICSINYCLYCYMQRSDYGKTRSVRKIYDDNGLNQFILGMERELNINGLPARLVELRKCDIYMASLNNLRMHPKELSNEARKGLESRIKKYCKVFYLSSIPSIWEKLKNLISHALVLMRV